MFVPQLNNLNTIFSALREKFYMVKKLGGGGFGTVYLVQMKNTKELLAAKHQKAKKAQDMRYMRRELFILQKLGNSELIVSLVDYFESSLQSVILTEYLVGGELFELISSKDYSLTEDKCRGFVKQVTNRCAGKMHSSCFVDFKRPAFHTWQGRSPP